MLHNILRLYAHIPGYRTWQLLIEQFFALTCLSVAHSTSSVAILPCFSVMSTYTCALAVASFPATSLACFACALTAINRATAKPTLNEVSVGGKRRKESNTLPSAMSASWASMAVRCCCSSAHRFAASSSRSAAHYATIQ